MESISKQKASKECKERNIQVFVRVRPLNSAEKAAKSCSIVDCSSSREITVKERINDKITKTFGFDRVFSQESRQVDVYKYVVNPLIDEVLAGYNCTVFAYGQTGTGKTFTMEGEKSNDPSISWQDDPLSGIVPRAMNHMFDELRLLGDAEFTVRVSFLEIYNEELIDLLSPTDDINKLRLFEDSARKGSVIIQGLEEKAVHNKDEVYKILEKGSQKRQTAATQMNAHSSRSHTIFTITIHIKDNSLDGEELLRTGKLNLVDLAGSENIGRSGAQDKRAREAGNINQSLLTLGRCITALVEKTPHIPYRESKLTRLLQDSLGGRTKTSIIATVSPAQLNMEETLSTLDYAHRAKNITNRPEINQKMSKKALIREYTEEIEKLRRDLQATRDKNGVFIASENYDGMVNELEYLRSELSNKINNIKAMVEQKENLEKVLDDLKISAALEIEGKTKELESAKEKIVDVEYEKREQEFLVSKHKETEELLCEQAQQIKDAVEEATYDLSKLQATLERVRKLEKCNATNVKQLADKVEQSAAFFSNFTEDHCEQVNKCVGQVKQDGDNSLQQEVKFVDNVQGQISGLDSLVDNIVACTGQNLTRFQTDHEALIGDLATNLKAKMVLHDEFCSKVSGEFNELCGTLLQTDLMQFETNQADLQSNLSAVKDKLVSMQSDNAMIEAALNENEIATVQKVEDIEAKLIEIHSEDTQLDQFDQDKYQTIQQLTSTATELTSTVTELTSNTTELTSKLSQMTSKLSQVTSTLSQVTSTLSQLRSDMAEHREQKTRVRSKMIEVPDQFAELKSEMGARDEKLMQTLQQDTAKKTENIIQHVMVTGEETQTKTTSAMNNVKARLETLSSNFAGAMEESKEIQESQVCESEEHCDKVRSSIKTHVDELNKLTLEGIGTGVKGRTSVLRDSVNNHLSAFNLLSASTNTHMDSTEQHLAALSHTLKTQHKCTDIINSFVKTQYLADTPSGETPPRKEFRYPGRFASTSPHERLIEKFRLTMPRSQFGLQEEEEDSTPLTALSEESDSSLPKPRRSSSLNDLRISGGSNANAKESISPTTSDIVVRRPNARKVQKENNSNRKLLNAGKIPIISKTKSAENVVKATGRRGVLLEKN